MYVSRGLAIIMVDGARRLIPSHRYILVSATPRD